ncbi:hypothetical protein [Pseudoalteromonas obscura]|uniref:Uncharacterized protein n=1 Tax=Pseudoalteromonas obscura TaxID=3048491 RepID=A0ABT7EFE7_9GAMM|nr:hypothetical protein [Pseudoalteromonas sp. P94(2023)]MDK2594013.1 hypothetical protein [Pseudoalteromonas sp. P94(2023)]
MQITNSLILSLLFTTCASIANCPEPQSLDIQTSIKKRGVEVEGHGFMDIVTISVPQSVSRIPFESIQLTYGEVAEYWIPLDTKVYHDRIIAKLNGYQASIEDFEFQVNYTNGLCSFYQTGSISSAYSKVN